MPRLADVKALSVVAIDKALPRAERYEIADAVVPGFRVLVHPSGKKSFVVRYTMHGRYAKHTLGPATGAGLKLARDAARRALECVTEGRDPATARGPVSLADGTLAAMIKTYRDMHVSKLADGTAAYTIADFDRLQDALPGRQLRGIKKSELVAELDRAAKRGPSAAVTAWKVWRAFFNWCEGRLDDYASPMRGMLKPADEPSRDRVLNDAELKAVWLAADKAGGSAGATVKLLMLTGCRRTEIMALERGEITADAIELSAERTKNGHAHSVPLTEAMRAVLAPCPKFGRYIINGLDAAPGSHSKMKASIAADIPAWTFHDLRRSFASGLQRLGVAPHVIDRAINHRSGVVKGVTAIYQRHEYASEVKAAVELWSQHISEIVKAKRLAA